MATLLEQAFDFIINNLGNGDTDAHFPFGSNLIKSVGRLCGTKFAVARGLNNTFYAFDLSDIDIILEIDEENFNQSVVDELRRISGEDVHYCNTDYAFSKNYIFSINRCRRLDNHYEIIVCKILSVKKYKNCQGNVVNGTPNNIDELFDCSSSVCLADDCWDTNDVGFVGLKRYKSPSTRFSKIMLSRTFRSGCKNYITKKLYGDNLRHITHSREEKLETVFMFGENGFVCKYQKRKSQNSFSCMVVYLEELDIPEEMFN